MPQTTDLEPVIGLEVHAQLKTQTKMFCGCALSFGEPPNTLVCPVCLGLPGSLPVPNALAFEFALKTAVALHCEIVRFTKFDRKNYYYPDLPKNYQISQYDLPFTRNGRLDIQVGGAARRIGITRIHIEEDAGKLMHFPDGSGVDLNRAGTPLLEIVSEPDLRSAAEARAYLRRSPTSSNSSASATATCRKAPCAATPMSPSGPKARRRSTRGARSRT